MNKNELKMELEKLKIPPEFYSILEGIKPDAIILDHYHGIWKTFYFSERGESHDERLYISEDEACQYVFERFKQMKRI
jgi:hypothetical protein